MKKKALLIGAFLMATGTAGTHGIKTDASERARGPKKTLNQKLAEIDSNAHQLEILDLVIEYTVNR